MQSDSSSWLPVLLGAAPLVFAAAILAWRRCTQQRHVRAAHERAREHWSHSQAERRRRIDRTVLPGRAS
jgi:hypothetical protein